MNEVVLGQKYRDLITGYEGVVVCRTVHLYGCIRVSLQGPMNKDGELPEWKSFDEPQLLGVSPEGAQDKGGPRPEAKQRFDAGNWR